MDNGVCALLLCRHRFSLWYLCLGKCRSRLPLELRCRQLKNAHDSVQVPVTQLPALADAYHAHSKAAPYAPLVVLHPLCMRPRCTFRGSDSLLWSDLRVWPPEHLLNAFLDFSAPGAVSQDHGLPRGRSLWFVRFLRHAQVHALRYDRGCVERDIVHDETRTRRKSKARAKLGKLRSVYAPIVQKRRRTLH